MKPLDPRPENPRAAKISHVSKRIPRHHDWTHSEPHPELRTYNKIVSDKPRKMSELALIGCNIIPQTMAMPMRPQTDMRQLRHAGIDTPFTGSLVAAVPFTPLHPLTVDAKHRFRDGFYGRTEERKRRDLTVSTYG